MEWQAVHNDKAREAGRKLFVRPCTFVLSAAALTQLPHADRAEVAFVGRSNVGKSSLINALCGRRQLAKTSATPGRTQQLNYFNLDDKLYLVDLPGYGFAKAPPPEVRKWQGNMLAYLQGRPNLKRVFLLLDSRFGAKTNDLEIMDLLDTTAVTYQLVLTKADKINKTEFAKRQAEMAALLPTHPAAYPLPLFTSAENKLGLEDLQAEIAALL